jgi:bifunctional DNase/RNase
MVLLLDPDQRRAVPVFIGESEAFSIRLRLSEQHYPRPLTHDLLDSMVAKLGGKIEQVRVERVEEGAFVATVVLTRAGEVSELDARTSDAIALALGNRAPILMAEEVLKSSALDLDRLPKMTPPDPATPPNAAEPSGSAGVEM